MSHLFKVYNSYSDYLTARRMGEFANITYTITAVKDTQKNGSKIEVHVLNYGKTTNDDLMYDSYTAQNLSLSYWTSHPTAIANLVNRFSRK